MKVIDKSKGIRKNIDIIAIAEQQSDRILRGTEEEMKSSGSDEGRKESRAKKGKHGVHTQNSGGGRTGDFSKSSPASPSTPSGAASPMGGLKGVVPTGGH